MTGERLSGLVHISRRTFSLKFTIFIFQAQNQRRVGFAVWGDWEGGRRQAMQENRRGKNFIIMQTEEMAVERESEKTEWRSLWSENDRRCDWNQKKGDGIDGLPWRKRETEERWKRWEESSHSPPYSEELSPSVLPSILTHKVHTAAPSLALFLSVESLKVLSHSSFWSVFVIRLTGFQNSDAHLLAFCMTSGSPWYTLDINICSVQNLVSWELGIEAVP